jgi:hypothetical protein
MGPHVREIKETVVSLVLYTHSATMSLQKNVHSNFYPKGIMSWVLDDMVLLYTCHGILLGRSSAPLASTSTF